MATKAKATSEANSLLVSAYIELATSRNSSSWDFFYLAKDFSVRVVKDSIKRAQKDSGLNLPDLTPTKAQHFATLSAIQDKFDVSATLPFSKAISLAYRADETLKAEGARALVGSSVTLEDFIASVPKTKREPKPASEKFAGEVVESSADIDTLILEMAQGMTEMERVKFAKQLVSLSKLIVKMETVTA